MSRSNLLIVEFLKYQHRDNTPRQEQSYRRATDLLAYQTYTYSWTIWIVSLMANQFRVTIDVIIKADVDISHCSTGVFTSSTWALDLPAPYSDYVPSCYYYLIRLPAELFES